MKDFLRGNLFVFQGLLELHEVVEFPDYLLHLHSYTQMHTITTTELKTDAMF